MPDLCRAGPRAYTWYLSRVREAEAPLHGSHLRALAAARSDLLVQAGLRNGFTGLQSTLVFSPCISPPYAVE